jgi:predicted RecA/RadA family phage recombinase
MKNYVQEGKVLNYTVPAAGVTSGDLVLVESIVGVCASTGVEDDVIALAVEGVYSVPKVAGAISQGQAVYFLDGDVTTADEGGSPWGSLVKAGVAAAAAESGDTTVPVLLNK